MNKTEIIFYKEILDRMDFNKIKLYKNPCIITMSGMAGSGKTTLAKELSKQLNIYLLSQDFIRNYYCTNIEEYNEDKRLYIDSIVKKCNAQRLIKLLYRRIPFVIDGNINTKEKFDQLKLICLILKYKLIKIKINSNDEDNIKRIISRPIGLTNIDERIIGDNVNYSTHYTEKEYYEIKKRKIPKLEDVEFDYILNNYNSSTEFLSDINDVILDIKNKKLIL